MAEPHITYSRLLDERRARLASIERQHRRMGYAKLSTAVFGGAIVWLALLERALSIVWLLTPIAAFAALVVLHDRLLAERERQRRAARFFENALARLEGHWAGRGDAGEEYRQAAHLYAADLDLFGKGSLFELISTARTHIGQDTLAQWLLAPADPATVLARQAAIEELRPRLDLREDLAIVAEEARTGVDPVSLAAWGEAPPLLGQPKGCPTGGASFRLPLSLRARIWIHTALGLLAAAAAILLALHAAGVLALSGAAGALLRDGFLVVLVANAWFLHRHHASIGGVAAAVEEAAHELGLLSEVLVRLERERFVSPLLAGLEASLEADGAPPSRRLARLNRLVDVLDSRDHVLVRVLEPFVLWTAHVALKVEEWRRHSGPAVRRWLTAAGEIEALCSLASHAYEHPADPFPELAEGPACLEGEGIGHPLIPEERVVRNDVRIGGPLRVLIVSGSNMSGKSTLLRTLGVNAVLALAGGTVRARRLRLTPLALGASIRVTDSLQDGVSRFYAEIVRIRQILDQTAEPVPVLFLIDEFLHGTNSHDRRIGAEALVRGLVERGAIGLVTTHDLALAEIAEALGGRAANVHFEDRIENGRILFDYVMRPGVVRKSNALELMRHVGLEI
jgi:hypothetical protein